MSAGIDAFLQHLRDHGYHPRSDKHSNALAEGIVSDLLRHCMIVRERAVRGEVVYQINFDLSAGTAVWNVDLVLGPPALDATRPPDDGRIRRDNPSAVQIAIELKSVMTEHRKAVKNRKRDLEAHHEHVHNYDNNAIAGGVLVINAAPTFKSPLRPAVTVHKSPDALVKHCIDELRAVNVRGGSSGYGLEAKAAVVISADNVDATGVGLATGPAVPRTGDPLHYDGFIRALCEQYRRRY